MANSVYEIILKLTGAPQTKSSLEETERSVNLLTQAMGRVIPALNNAGDAMLGLAARAKKANAEMEQGISNYAGIVGISMDAARDYNESLDAVAEATSNQISRNDLLTSSYDAASAGFLGAEEALGLLTAAGNLAIAGNSGLGDATDNLQSSQLAIVATMKNYADTLSEYGDAAAQADHVSRLLYKTIELGITDVKQLAPEWAEIAPAAKSAGLSMEDLGGSLAVLTGLGIKTTIATTQLKAGLTSIATGGRSDDAKAAIKRLGLEFDSATLQTKGLIGVLESLSEAGITSYGDLLELTGRVEGAQFFAALLGDMDKTRAQFGKFSGDLKDVSELARGKAAEGMGRLTAAVNAFDTEMAKAGDNIAPVKALMTELATEVVAAFNDLPDWAQKVVGSFIVVGGASAKAGAGIADIATNIIVAKLAYGQWVAAVAKAAAASSAATGTTVALGGAQTLLATATTGATAALTAFQAKAVLMAPALLTVGALVGALTVGYKDLQNQLAEKRNEAAFLDTEAVGAYTGALTRAIEKMRETKKALPTAEFQQHIAALKEAGGESNAAARHIEVLTKIQEDYTNGTGEAAVATVEKTATIEDAGDKIAQLTSLQQQLTEQQSNGADVGEALAQVNEELARATGDVEAAEEAAAQAVEIRAKKQREALDRLSSGLGKAAKNYETFRQARDNAVQDGVVSIEQSYTTQLAALNKLAAANRNFYQTALLDSKIDAENKDRLRGEQLDKERQVTQQRLELQREYTDESRRMTDDLNTLQELKIEELANRERWTQERLDQELKANRIQFNRAKEQELQAQLDVVAAGSEKEVAIATALFRVKVQLAKDEGGLTRDLADSKVETAKDGAAQEVEAAKKAAEDARKARVDAWDTETSHYKEQLKIREESANLAAQRIRNALSNQAAGNAIKSDSLSNFEGLSGRNAEAASRLLEIEKEIAQVKADGNASGEVDLERLETLTAERDKQRAIAKLTNAELERSNQLLDEQGIKVSGAAGSDAQALSIAQNKLAIEVQGVAIKLRMQEIETQLNILAQDRLILENQRLLQAEDITAAEREALAAQIANAQEQKSLLKEQLATAKQLANLEVSNAVTQTRGGIASRGIDPRNTGAGLTVDTVKTAMAEGFKPGVEALLDSGKQNTQANLIGLQETSNSLTDGLTSSARGVVSDLGPGIAATASNTQQLPGLLQSQNQKLDSLNQSLTRLPGDIARLMPRPAPTARTK